MRLYKAVCPVVAVSLIFGGCGDPPAADRGEPEAARSLSEYVKDGGRGTLTTVRCQRRAEHEYRCTGHYRDPLLDNPALLEAVMSTEKDGIPSRSRESAVQLLESTLMTRRRYTVRFDPRVRKWSYERLCERC